MKLFPFFINKEKHYYFYVSQLPHLLIALAFIVTSYVKLQNLSLMGVFYIAYNEYL